jgi:hypothetical protein
LIRVEAGGFGIENYLSHAAAFRPDACTCHNQ